jgi:diaminohydroxyphosphoribosylaminopyrimidine deaminase/5-amino-6-(5-phosphoribosylamino)uracil reductase
MAINLAGKGLGMTSPNPMVGAVLVNNGKVVGKGYHKGPGQLHAEAVALRESGTEASGATLYVNLEPCCHTDKRTPPCTKEIIRSGIKRVVAGMVDPNPAVNGRGISELIDAGISVDKDILNVDAGRLNEIYTKFITSNIPFVILKSAASLDGKIALSSGESRWITGKVSRHYAHKLRSMVDAVMAGIGTVIADDPMLSVRHVKSKGGQPLRIIVDSKLRIPLTSKVLDVSTGQKTMVVTTRQSPAVKIKELENLGIRTVIADTGEPLVSQRLTKDDENTLPFKGRERPVLREVEGVGMGFSGEVSLQLLMNILGKSGITSVLIEGGSEINASALREGIVDKIVLIYSARIIGGRDSIGIVGGHSPKSLDESVFLKDVSVRRMGEDIIVEGYVRQ